MNKISDNEFIHMVGVAIDKLEKQGVPAKTSDGGCKYLTDDGLCCIVGHMMPNDNIRLMADTMLFGISSGITCLVKNSFEWTTQFTRKQVNLLAQLQRLHDNSNSETFHEQIKSMKFVLTDCKKNLQ